MVAASLVAERGVAAVTVRGLARAAGVSTGVVSHYFQNSEDMLFAAYRTAYHSSGRRFQAALDQQPGLDGVLAALESSMPTNADGLAEWRVRIAFWGVSDFGETIRDYEEEASAAFMDMLAAALEACDVRGDCRALATDLEALITGLAVQHLMTPDAHPRDQISERLRVQFYQGVHRYE